MEKKITVNINTTQPLHKENEEKVNIVLATLLSNFKIGDNSFPIDCYLADTLNLVEAKIYIRLLKNSPSIAHNVMKALSFWSSNLPVEVFEGEPEEIILSAVDSSLGGLSLVLDEEGVDRPYWVDQRSSYGVWKLKSRLPYVHIEVNK